MCQSIILRNINHYHISTKMLAYLTCLNREFVTIIISHLRTMLLTRKQKKILFTYRPFMGCTFTFSLLTAHFDSSIGCYYLFVKQYNGSAMHGALSRQTNVNRLLI